MRIEFKNYTHLDKFQKEEILDIRNTDYVRMQMKTESIISLKDHFEWIEKLKKDETRFFFAVIHNGSIVGSISLINIDMNTSSGYLGLYYKKVINPLISSLSTYIFLDHCFVDLKFKTIYLEVLESNKSAIKFDLNFGFQIEKELVIDNKRYYLMSNDHEHWEEKKSSPILGILQKKASTIKFDFEG